MIKVLTPEESARIKSPAATPQILANAVEAALLEGGWRYGCEVLQHMADPVAQRAFLRVRSGDRIIRIHFSLEN